MKLILMRIAIGFIIGFSGMMLYFQSRKTQPTQPTTQPAGKQVSVINITNQYNTMPGDRENNDYVKGEEVA